MNEEQERWVDVADFEGLYQVSNLGSVRSLDRINTKGDRLKGKRLKSSHTPTGYAHVSLWRANRKADVLVHRIVAKAFLPNPEGLPQVNHKDGNIHNNSVANLEWISAAGNTIHAARVLCVLDRRAVVGTHLTTGNQLRFSSLAEAEEAGFTRALIALSVKGKRTHHKGYRWEDAAIDAAIAAGKAE